MANILFLGAGRRVELLKRFWRKQHTLFSYETSYNVPIRSLATIIKGLAWNQGKDAPSAVCKDLYKVYDENKIDLVIPCQDEAMWILSLMNKNLNAVAPEPDAGLVCFNKRWFEKFMLADFPHYYPVRDDRYWKNIVKPTYGFGSKGVVDLDEIDEHVANDYLDNPSMVIQKKLTGIECSVDAYFTRDSKFVDAVPRKRDRVSGGEVISSTTFYNAPLIAVTKAIGEKLKLVGPANFQYANDGDAERFKLFEINSRFCGGYTLSLEAGLDAIGFIEEEYLGIGTALSDYVEGSWTKNLHLERSYRDHYFTEKQ